MRLKVFIIKKHMAYKQFDINKLAVLIGIKPQNLSTILRRGTCSIPNAGRIATALSVNLEEIVEE